MTRKLAFIYVKVVRKAIRVLTFIYLVGKIVMLDTGKIVCRRYPVEKVIHSDISTPGGRLLFCKS